MPTYNLNQLGDKEFERLSQSLLKVIIGNGTITFADGPDGNREATFRGKAPYPSESEQWDGDWIFQVKFHDTQRIGPDKARKNVITEFEQELKKVVKKHKCDNYVFITNVLFSSVLNKGTHDRFASIAKQFSDRIPHISYLDGDDICKYLEIYSDIRRAYHHFLTTGDVLASIIDKLDLLPSIIDKLDLLTSIINRPIEPQVSQTHDKPKFLSKLAVSNYSLLQKPTSVSRRTVLVGLIGLGTAVSGITLLTHSFYNVPIGTTLYIYRGHPRIVTSVAWSPNGKLVASGGDDTTVQVWSPSTGNKIFTYDGHLDAITSIAWSSNGGFIASCSADKTTQVWDPTNGWVIGNYNEYLDLMRVIVWSPNSEYIAFAGGNEWKAHSDTAVRVWNTTTGKLTFVYPGHTDRVTGLAWSPNSNRIASTSYDSTLQVWDAFSGKQNTTYREDFSLQTSVSWSPDGKYIASANETGEVKIRDIVGKVISSHKAQGDITALAWSPNGKHLALASNDFLVEIWNAMGDHVFTYRGHSQQVTSVAWSPDSTRIASSSYDSTVQIWKAPFD